MNKFWCYFRLISGLEKSIDTLRREYLDQTLFWGNVDLQNKLDDFTHYYNHHRVHSLLGGEILIQYGEKRTKPMANVANFRWHLLYRGFVQLPIPA